MFGSAQAPETWAPEVWGPEEEMGLVMAAQAGDLKAFDGLARRYRKGALAITIAILDSAEMAEDAVQDSLLAAYKALPRLKEPSAFAAWLGAIVRHRSRRIAAGARSSPRPLDHLILAYAPSITQEVEEADRSSVVRRAVGDLVAEIRPCVELFYFEGWPVRQIGAFLGLPETTVKWRLHAARKQLRTTLLPFREECK